MDIIGAMNKEREYLSFRAKGEEPYHLVDAVKEYGFESLKEYFEAKRDYQFSQLKFEVVETTPERGLSELFNAIQNQTTAVGFMYFDRPAVLYGNQNDTNIEYCKECGLEVYPYYSKGGTIVAAAGDINVAICVPKSLDIDSRYIMDNLLLILKKHTNKTVTIDGNDMMIDGQKVFGGTSYVQNDMFAFAATISLSDRSELISNICLKHSTKQPGYIDFMNREQLRWEVLEWLAAQ